VTVFLVFCLIVAVLAAGVGWGAVLGAAETYRVLRPERHAGEMAAQVTRISAEIQPSMTPLPAA
jgi:hypothetical protein